MNGKNGRILVIDDTEAIHADFRKILAPPQTDEDQLLQAASALFGEVPRPLSAAARFEMDSARQGAEGLQRVVAASRQDRPYAMAFVDIRMPPGWDGVETVRRIWEVDSALQIVFCTAYTDRSWEETVAELGLTDRFVILKKPFDNIEVRQLAVAMTVKWDLERQVRQQVANLERTVAERTFAVTATRDLSVFALAKLAESRDPETGEHLERIRGYCQLLAQQLRRVGPYVQVIDESFLSDLYRSSPLHDIGKVGIPDAILLKPDRLTPDEFEVMKQHVEIGANALETVVRQSRHGSFLEMATDIARCHHERFNGTGYPLGLKGHDIPLAARIVALADVYDALTSARVYKKAIRSDVAREMILAEDGRHFDPAVVEAFRTCYEDFLKLQKSMDDHSRVSADMESCQYV
ncbi:MAG TPA: HD domain-containing phosphohydrolase [Pirellulales bacterium]|jgi:putative two-component system response regulator|nr:HD domain-containing phosphohydrolase [Pirellulales bacterium]